MQVRHAKMANANLRFKHRDIKDRVRSLCNGPQLIRWADTHGMSRRALRNK